MRFTDLSPPSSPTFDQQHDALRKGLGRAMQWAESGRLGEGPLLEACLEDLRFDTQIDESRAEWLWRLIQAVRCADRIRVPILHALHELSDERSADQLCELARCYAQAGDEAFRTRLYEIVELKPFAEGPRLGEDEIIELDGESAFLFAGKSRGKQLRSRDWRWDDEMLMTHVVELWGEQRVAAILENANDDAIELLRRRWLKHRQSPSERTEGRSRAVQLQAMTVDEIVAIAASDSPPFTSFRGWGIHADESALAAVVSHLWATKQPRSIANLLQIFSRRPFPQFDDRLLELCRHSDALVRRQALIALEKLAHPSIREYAVAELERGLPEPNVVKLFKMNFRAGDERRLLNAIELPADADEHHWLLMDVIDVLEQNPTADPSQLGIICYAETPCEMCRFRAAELLAERQAAPSWLIAECRFDSYQRIAEQPKLPTTNNDD